MCAKESVTAQLSTTHDYPITDSLNSPAIIGTVRLLHLTRVPPCHAKLAMEGKDQHFSLEPVESLLANKSILVESEVAQSDKDGKFTLVLQNYTGELIYLKEGEVIGHTQAAQIEESFSLPAEEAVKRVEAAPEQSEPKLTLEEGSLLHLSQEEKEQLHSCLQEYADFFAKEDSGLGSTDLVTHVIDTGNHPPITQPPQRLPFVQHVEEMIEKMENQGIVQPSKSPWASSIVLVTKRDRSTRFCVD